MNVEELNIYLYFKEAIDINGIYQVFDGPEIAVLTGTAYP